MFQVLLIIHLLIVLALIGVVLMQRSEGGGLGIGGGGGGGMGGFMTGRGTANLLTRTTAILAGAFMATSLALAIIAGGGRQAPSSILDGPVLPSGPAPAQTQTPGQGSGGGGAPAAPAPGPAAPSVPVQ